jgi:murein L,D-transpeptidase YcbB/YkuD
MKKILFSLLITFFALPSASDSLHKMPAVDFNSAISRIVSADDHPLLDKNIFLNYKKALDELYFLSPEQQLWIKPYNSSYQQINSALQLIATANASGLEAEHYNLTGLQTIWQQLSSKKNISYTELALLDTAVSINLIHFLSDLHFGRINPMAFNFSFNTHKDSFVFIPLILNAIQNNKIAQLSSLVEPSFPIYHKLKKALLDYRKKQSGQSIKRLKYSVSLSPGDPSLQIIEIRQQLSLLGVEADKNNLSIFYDQQLVSQIKEFQFLHGLRADGVIGRNTIRALNIPISQYIKKIILALERFRWLPKIQSGPVVMVNIPSFQLWAYHSDKTDETQALNMKVIVGKSDEKERKSPVFTANMYYLVFSPYWNIPKSITIEEILPKLLEDPLYLEQRNIELVARFREDEPVLPYTEDKFERLQSGSLKLRQRPGKGNALGKVKFIFPNSYSVYIHDSPARHLFNRSKRDLSHGCIRVEKPAELAHFLLGAESKWDQRKIIKAMHLQSPKKVRLKKAVPVIIYYSTASVVRDEVVFYNDIYDYDAKLSQALMEHNNIPSVPLVSIANRN